MIEVVGHPTAIALTAVLGLILGSFFNVLIHRIPLQESIVSPRSRCPHCKTIISWWSNIPVMSFLVQRGRCASCKASISWKYPSVEIATAFLLVSLLLKFGWSAQWVAYSVLSCGLLVLSVIDLEHFLLPDVLTLPGILLGFAACFWTRDITWLSSLSGIFVGGGILLAVAYSYEKLTGREGLGGGDIKLLALLGAWLGVEAVLPILICSSFSGSAVGIAWMLLRRKNLQTAIPYGPYLSMGGVLYLFFREEFLGWMYPNIP